MKKFETKLGRMITNNKTRISVPEKLGLSGQSFEQSWEIVKHAIDHIYIDDMADLSFNKYTGQFTQLF